MLDVHPPHSPTHTWKDFFIHIATIVVGLLIAVGLEQTVEAIHHHHQLETLREQMHEVLQQNLELDAADFRMFAALRDRLIDLRSQIDGDSAAPPQPSTGLAIFPRLPGIAPYEAAKENGTVALLTSAEIRIFNRLSLQREFQLAAVRDWNDSLRDLDAFEERFVDNKGDRLFGDAMASVDIAKLSQPQREKYSELVAAVIKRTDLVDARVRVFDAQCRLVLGGTQDENSLFQALPR